MERELVRIKLTVTKKDNEEAAQQRKIINNTTLHVQHTNSTRGIPAKTARPKCLDQVVAIQ